MSQYITVDELIELGCMPSVDVEELEATDPGIVTKIIVGVSGLADSWLQKRYETPFASNKIPDGLKLAVAQITAYRLYMRRGFNPSSTQDEFIKLLSDEAMAWLKSASTGEIELNRFSDQTPNLDENGPLFASDGNDPYKWIYGKKNKYGYGKGGGCGGC